MKTNKKIKNNILLEKNKIKKNLSFYKILAITKECVGSRIYLIEIFGNYKFVNLYNSEIYAIEFHNMIKCSVEIWEKLKIYNNNNAPSDKISNVDVINSSDESSFDESTNLNEIDKMINNKLDYSDKNFKRSNSFSFYLI